MNRSVDEEVADQEVVVLIETTDPTAAPELATIFHSNDVSPSKGMTGVIEIAVFLKLGKEVLSKVLDFLVKRESVIRSATLNVEVVKDGKKETLKIKLTNLPPEDIPKVLAQCGLANPSNLNKGD